MTSFGLYSAFLEMGSEWAGVDQFCHKWNILPTNYDRQGLRDWAASDLVWGLLRMNKHPPTVSVWLMHTVMDVGDLCSGRRVYVSTIVSEPLLYLSVINHLLTAVALLRIITPMKFFFFFFCARAFLFLSVWQLQFHTMSVVPPLYFFLHCLFIHAV